MTVWVWQRELSADEEAHVRERPHLELPYGALPDLSRITNPQQCRQMLQMLYPDDPPETINGKQERIWKIFSHLQPEDTIVVPLCHTKEVALAEVIKPYEYKVGEGGSDIHLMPVKWFGKRVSMRSLSKYKMLFRESGDAMFEVTDKEARVAIREKLPHGYNRFVALKWVLIVIVVLRILRTVGRYWQHSQ